MKNILMISMLDSCSCDCLLNVASGTNEIILDIQCDVSLNPKLVINGDTVNITENSFSYNVPLLGTSVTFNLVNDEHTGDTFTITLPTTIDSDLIVSQVDNFNYVGKCVQKKSNGLPIATTQKLGGIKVGATLNITDEGLLNANDSEGVTLITNTWLEEHLV